jgi:hypothetical protein
MVRRGVELDAGVNGSGLARSAGGQLLTSTDPPDNFNGGAPATNDGRLCIAESAPETFAHGVGYLNDGRICVSYGGASVNAYSRGGLPMTADGRVICEPGAAVFHFMRSLPMSVGSEVAVEGEAPVPPVSGYDSGYDNGYGA